MPELPEVEHGRRLAERVMVGRSIRRVDAHDDDIVFDGISPADFAATLEGRSVVAAHRHGKQLWLELDRAPHPLIHFGMTGALLVPGGTPLALESGIDPGSDWPPRFTKLDLELDDGGRIAFVNARRLGRLRLRDDPKAEPPISKLGFDPLLGLPSKADFIRRARRRRGAVKAVLLDQKFAAGVGNWIADEVLYQAGIDPRRPFAELSDDELAAVLTKLAHVIRLAVEVDAVKERLPRSWLFHHRWGKEEGATTDRGEPIQHIEVAGRTTAWVPSVQR